MMPAMAVGRVGVASVMGFVLGNRWMRGSNVGRWEGEGDA